MPKHIFPSTLTEKTPIGIYRCPPNQLLPQFEDRYSKHTINRRLKRKSWIFCSSYTKDYFIGMALVDVGYLAKAFCYVYDCQTGNVWEDSQIKPIGFSTSFSANPSDEWKLKPYELLLQHDTITLQFNGSAFKIHWNIKLNPSGLLFICPSHGKNRPFHSTFKNLGLSQQINISTSNKNIHIDSPTACIDYSYGYPPRKTMWNWLSITGTDEKNRQIALNLVDHFNNNLENYIWIDHQPYPVGDVRFIYDKRNKNKPWRIESKTVELTFHVDWQRGENLNIGILKSSFIQVMGRVQGTIRIENMEPFYLKANGVCEDHHALW